MADQAGELSTHQPLLSENLQRQYDNLSYTTALNEAAKVINKSSDQQSKAAVSALLVGHSAQTLGELIHEDDEGPNQFGSLPNQKVGQDILSMAYIANELLAKTTDKKLRAELVRTFFYTAQGKKDTYLQLNVLIRGKVGELGNDDWDYILENLYYNLVDSKQEALARTTTRDIVKNSISLGLNAHQVQTWQERIDESERKQGQEIVRRFAAQEGKENDWFGMEKAFHVGTYAKNYVSNYDQNEGHTPQEKQGNLRDLVRYFIADENNGFFDTFEQGPSDEAVAVLKKYLEVTGNPGKVDEFLKNKHKLEELVK